MLAVGGKAHVALVQRGAVRHGNGLFAQALHVERGLALALRDGHARVEDARFHHRAQAFAQLCGVDVGHPRADGVAVTVKHADQRVSEIGGFEVGGIDRRFADVARAGNLQIGKVCGTARSPGGLWHMQPQG